MDLGAYVNIDNLSKIVETNSINVPRLRGYRLMSEEKPLTEEEIQEAVTVAVRYLYERMCQCIPKFTLHPWYREFSYETDIVMRKFLDENGELRWNLIHGKRRKNIKFAIKKQKEKVRKQYETWNKYAERKDVLYIHARIGGNNWLYYGGDEIEKQSWFLEKVDDYYDSTYCDIYARIKT